jgi:hypothetical protein
VGYVRPGGVPGDTTLKRKCGTCKYFEDRGVANSGVCQHAQRRELRDVVLVRQSELACRNSWDQDLWEPGPESLHESVLLEGSEEDSVVSNTVVSRRRHNEIFGGSEDVPMLSPYGEEADRVTGFGFGGLRSAGDEDNSHMDQQTSMQHDNLGVRSTVLETRKQLDQERRAVIQKRQIYDLDAIDQRMRSTDAVGAHLEAQQPGSGLRTPDASLARGENPAAAHATSMQSEIHPERTNAATDGNRQDSPGLRGRIRLNEESASAGHQPTEQLPILASHEQFRQRSNESGPHQPFVHIDGRVYGGDSTVVASESASIFVQPEASDPVDQQERLRTVRRCCGTCRDFRQVGDGSRGQCVNPYAFGDRRMVQSDQLACRSSLGMWWMPNDEVWLERADTSHHGRPTPLLDAALRAKRGDETGRDSRQ